MMKLIIIFSLYPGLVRGSEGGGTPLTDTLLPTPPVVRLLHRPHLHRHQALLLQVGKVVAIFLEDH